MVVEPPEVVAIITKEIDMLAQTLMKPKNALAIGAVGFVTLAVGVRQYFKTAPIRYYNNQTLDNTVHNRA